MADLQQLERAIATSAAGVAARSQSESSLSLANGFAQRFPFGITEPQWVGSSTAARGYNHTSNGASRRYLWLLRSFPNESSVIIEMRNPTLASMSTDKVGTSLSQFLIMCSSNTWLRLRRDETPSHVTDWTEGVFSARWTAPVTCKTESVRSRIQAYGKLGPDWAGLNTVAPVATTIGYALSLLDSLPPEIELPLAAASGDGEIIFTWLANGDRIETAIDEDGFLSWASRTDGIVRPGGSIDLAECLPDVFIEVLTRHFE